MSEFYKSVLPSGQTLTMCEIKGVHIFKSFSMAKGLQGDFLKSLVTETCKINNNDVTVDVADNLSADDTMYIIEVLSTQLQKLDL